MDWAGTAGQHTDTYVGWSFWTGRMRKPGGSVQANSLPAVLNQSFVSQQQIAFLELLDLM